MGARDETKKSGLDEDGFPIAEEFNAMVDEVIASKYCARPKRLAPPASEVNGFFLDIGIPEDLDRAQTELAEFMI